MLVFSSVPKQEYLVFSVFIMDNRKIQCIFMLMSLDCTLSVPTIIARISGSYMDYLFLKANIFVANNPSLNDSFLSA